MLSVFFAIGYTATGGMPPAAAPAPPAPGATADSASAALQFRGGRNRIVISENEFPTIGQIAHAQELRGAEVIHVAPDADAYAAFRADFTPWDDGHAAQRLVDRVFRERPAIHAELEDNVIYETRLTGGDPAAAFALS